MNYIRHLNHVLEQFYADKRILPRHICMYIALFHIWNKLRFPKVIQIFRSELMPLAKLGSLKYYHLTLQELDEWGYIRYHPSKSAYKGSEVYIITCSTSETSSGISTGTSDAISSSTTSACSTETSTGTSSDTTGDTQLINNYKTLINNTNNSKPITNDRARVGDAPSLDELNERPIEETNVGTPKEANAKRRFHKPDMKELKQYFQLKEADPIEAQRFYNHFESNGWKVGGKSPMKDWKAAVRNWILNTARYNGVKTKEINKNPLSTTNNKDYGEPL